MVVVLPEPFGPEQAEELAGRNLQVEPVNGEHLAVALGQALRVDSGFQSQRACIVHRPILLRNRLRL